jgi:hypothetical protein
MPIQQLTMAPQKVAESNYDKATAWVNQRKTFYDGSYFWAFFYDSADNKHKVCSSSNGKTWGSAQTLATLTDTSKLYLGQGVDIRWDESLGKGIVSIPYLDYFYWARIGTSGGVIGREVLSCPSAYTNYFIVAPRHGYIENKVLAYHQAVMPSISWKRGDMIAYHAKDIGSDGGLTSEGPIGTYSDINGGSVTLTRTVGGEDRAIYVVKDGDNSLHWGYLNATSLDLWNDLNITCADGLNTLSGCSETELGLGTGDQHIVYIKSTGELCYLRFNGTWSDETVLVASGASYPVIAAGKAGRLYVFYVKDGVIKQQKLRNLNGVIQVLTPEETLFPEHTYNNPAYLSSNQNVQHGQICLVWTEGTASPYEVWFCTIGD